MGADCNETLLKTGNNESESKQYKEVHQFLKEVTIIKSNILCADYKHPSLNSNLAAIWCVYGHFLPVKPRFGLKI